MRIMLWTPFFLPDIGGIETLMARLMPELARRGHQLILVTSHGAHLVPDETLHEGIPVYRFHFRSAVRKENLSLMLSILRQLATLRENFQPDLVHLHTSDPSGFFFLKTRKAHPCPTLVSFHNTRKAFTAHEPDTMLAELMAAGDWFTVVSRENLGSWTNLNPELASRMSVVHNGVAIPNLEPSPLPFEPPQLLCLGRLIPQKRLDLAVQAMGMLHEKYPALELTICGEGPLRAEIEAQIEALGLGKRTHLKNSVPFEQVPAMINESTMLVMPSDWEGLPMTAIEAASMARPVVASAAGGLPEVVLHGQSGLIVPRGDAPGLAQAISGLLDQPEKARAMGEAGRRHIQENFSLEATASGYENIYHRLV